ncbi:sensor histidine kinase [Terriglobus sp. RCC_193]|uniref:sensor histidine kinase n=1 Tax=Terriglobus sp. RCC_193 TaxID=3239218 RepID=UPI003525B3F4
MNSHAYGGSSMEHFSVTPEVKTAAAHTLGDVAMLRKPLPIRAWHIILFATVVIALATAAECHSVTDLSSVRYGFTLSGWWGLTAFAIWHIGKRWPASLRMNTVSLLLHTVAATILGVGHLLWMAAADDLFSHAVWIQKRLTWHHYLDLNRWGLEMLVYGFIFGVAAVTRLQLQAQQNAFQSIELQRALTAAQLHALQAQVEPHFLFNTLNSITELVESGHKQQATDMLRHLNTILKMTLRQSASQKISLAQELDVVENYLAIEQVRFADRLRVEFRIDPSALNALVPSFLLQPLMENAIRHGIGQSETGGMIRTFVERKDDMLYLRIQDNGSGSTVEKVKGHGIGLSNTATRLQHFYPDRHSFHAKPEERGGFLVRIAIPFETVAA